MQVSFGDGALVFGARLRCLDSRCIPTHSCEELGGCALIRELHVYGTLVAAGREESTRSLSDDRPQHIGCLALAKDCLIAQTSRQDRAASASAAKLCL